MSEITSSRGALSPPTSARLSLGSGRRFVSTQDHLEFQLDHARARDAVHALADFPALAAALADRGRSSIQLESAIADGAAGRQTYLRRPDLGRRLSPASAAKLSQYAMRQPDTPEVALIVADGLSALAIDRHALPLIEVLTPHLAAWRQAPVTLVRNGRVAIGDEIGQIFGAELTILLIGERPGLSVPDSLGVYLTWNPRVGRTDADRNCISNIWLEGLGYREAARRIGFYAHSARERGGSGFALKESGSPSLPSAR